MAKASSFDITSDVDLQEVDNAINQARKEITQRYDLKSLGIELEFQRDKALIQLRGPDAFALKQAFAVLNDRFARRGVPLKNIGAGKIVEAMSGARQELSLQQGIPDETARKLVKEIKSLKLKKTQAAIQGEQVRVSSPNKDDLQTIMTQLKEKDWGLELQFGNYR